MDKKSGKSAQKNKKSLPDYLEEAREIEAELDSMEDPWADDPEVEERLRKKVYQRIMEEQQKIIKKQSLPHKIGKYTVMFVITCIALFGVSMTSQANRQRFIRSITYMVGGKEAIEISNADDLDDSDDKEEYVREEIKEKLNCEYPNFLYRPSTFIFKDFSILSESQNAFVEYTYQEQVVSVFITQDNEKFMNQLSHQGDVTEQFEISNDQLQIKVIERADEGDEQPAYMAYWIYDNCYYDISGKIEKEEFIKLLENIRF